MRRVLYIDTRQQAGKHEHKNNWLKEHGVIFESRKLDFGDYAVSGSNVVVDTKRNISEVATNISRDHARFKREILRARDAGYRLIILIENDEGVLSLDNLTTWVNDHCKFCSYYRRGACKPKEGGKCAKHKKNKPIQGERLARAMQTMSDRYGVRFEFCTPERAAEFICIHLGIRYMNLCKDCFRFEDGKCKAAIRAALIEGPAQPVDGLKEMCDRGCPF